MTPDSQPALKSSFEELAGHLCAAPAAARVTVASTSGSRTFLVNPGDVDHRIGRGEDCVIRIPDELTEASRDHARIESTCRGVFLHDTSRHGVLVNGRSMEGCRRLLQGDTVTLAGVPSEVWSLKLEFDPWFDRVEIRTGPDPDPPAPTVARHRVESPAESARGGPEALRLPGEPWRFELALLLLAAIGSLVSVAILNVRG